MDDLPSFPTPGQSYAQAHPQSYGRKTSHPQAAYRPPPGNRMPSNQSYHQGGGPPPSQYRQPSKGYAAPSPADYYRQQQQQQQSYPALGPAPPPPQQQYSNQGYPNKVNYHQVQSPTYQQPPPTHTFNQQPPPQQHTPPQSQGYQNGNEYRKKPPPHNRSKESLHENSSNKNISSKQKLEMELKSVFDKVDLNHSGRISYSELSYALLNFDRTKFQDSTLRLMINLFGGAPGEYQNTSLTFDQFISLWKYLSAYKKLFIQADTDQSGDISFGEFQKVLEQIGYKLDIDLVLHLFSRYCTNTGRSSGGGSGSNESRGVGRLKFDSFIELLVYLRKLTDVFKKYDKDLSGTATIKFSEFLFEVSNLT